MTYTIKYQAGTYEGERKVNATDGDQAIAKVKAWVHKEMSIAMYFESYEIIKTDEK